MEQKIKKMGEFLKPGLFQFSIILIFLLFIVFSNLLGLPNSTVLSEFFLNQYTRYGLYIIIIAAFLEGLFVLSIYIPASLVIVLSAFALGFEFKTLFKIGATSLIGFTLANTLNYYLGRYGYFKVLLKLGGNQSIEKVQNDFNRNSFKTIFLTSFHPNFLAITFISAGIAKSKLSRILFQSILSLIFWISVWMSVIYMFFKDSKNVVIEDGNSAYYFVGILILWGLLKCIWSYLKQIRGTTG